MSFYSLVSAITEKNEEEKSKQEERYKESNDEQEEVKKQIAEIKEIKAQEKVERKALEGEGEEKKEGEDGIEGEEKKKDDKKLVLLCLDTLGQDRIFKDEEIDFVKIVGKTIRASMKKLKKKLLEKDRDIRIN